MENFNFCAVTCFQRMIRNENKKVKFVQVSSTSITKETQVLFKCYLKKLNQKLLTVINNLMHVKSIVYIYHML